MNFDANHTTVTLRFARRDGPDVTTLGILSVLVSPALAKSLTSFATADEGVLHHLQVALTAWINETPQGRAAWEASCEDFNIGDLDTLQDTHKASLQPFLQSQGILGTQSLVADGGDCFDFDTLLGFVRKVSS